MSTGVVLTVVAVALAVAIAGLFRLLGVLDSAELTLRRLVAGVRAARNDVGTANELAAAVERDAVEGRAGLQRLEDLKRTPPPADRG